MGWARAGLFLVTVLMLYPIAGWGQGGASTVEWVVSDGGGVEAGGHVTVKGLPANMIFGGTYTVAFIFTVEWFDWGSSTRPQSIEWYAKAGCLEEASGVCVRNSQNITLGSSTIDGSFSKNQTFSVTASLSLKDQPAVNGTVAAIGVRIAALIDCLDSSLCAPVGSVNPAQKFTFLRPESSVSFTVSSGSVPTNIIKNSGFEDGVDPFTGYPADWVNWTKHGGPLCSTTTSCITVDTARSFNGSASAKLDLGQTNIGFIALAQTLPSDLTFRKLTDSLYGLDLWFYYLPKFAGPGDFRIRVLYGEYAAELDYVFDPDPGLGYPNSTSTVTLINGTSVASGTKNIFMYGYEAGQWHHFHRNLRADWAAPLELPDGTFGPGFSLDIPLPRIQFDAIGFAANGSYYSETVWIDEVKLYESIGPPTPVPDFTLSASPESLVVQPGSTALSNITVESVNGFSGRVFLTADVSSGLSTPAITMVFGQPSLFLSSGGRNMTVLNIAVGNLTLSSSFNVLVSGNAIHYVRIIVAVPGTSELLQRGPWSLEWQLSRDDGIIISNVSYSGLPVLADARLPGILSTYPNNYCGPFYEEPVGDRIDPSQIFVEDVPSGGFQIRAPYYVPGESFEQTWRFQPDGSFQGLLVIGNGGCFPAHAYEARWRYSFDLGAHDSILSYDGSSWNKIEQESVLSDSGSRDSSHNNTDWAVTGGGSSVFFAPSDDTVPDTPAKVLAVVDRTGEVETDHSRFETPSRFINNETLAGADAAFWYVSTHSVESLDARPPNLAVLTGLNFYIRTPSDLAPVASFTVSPDCTAVGRPLTFDATSSYDPDGKISSYHWDFGDGTSSDGAVVTHSYPTHGSFGVTLTVQDNSTPPLLTQKQLSVVTSECLLSADFTITPAFIVPFTPVTFNATVSGGTPPYTFNWDFGDGVSSAGNPVVHAYANTCGGSFDVSLSVIDSTGVFVVVRKTVNIVGETFPLFVDFNTIPVSPISGQQAIFFAVATGGFPPYTFNWDFGDGEVSLGLTNSTVTHTYAPSGVQTVYVVTLSVTDACHLQNSVIHHLTVQPENIAPVAAFTFSPVSPRGGQVVTFDGSSSFDPDGNIISWEWSFGDVFCIPGPCPGQIGPLVYHVYSGPANYTVTLTVTDNLGGRTSISQAIHVLAPFDHDVSVDNIRAQSTAIQGQQVGILVALRNTGVHNETVRLVVLWDSTPITDQTRFLPAPSSDPFGGLVFVKWDTTGVPPGNHTISATVYLDSDQDLSNNSFTDGTVTILPPPTITLTPSSGTLGTKVVVTGIGFPIPQYGAPGQVIMSFDDQFTGFVVPRNGSFAFTFDIPHAEPGIHQVKAFDTYSLIKATADLQVLEAPTLPELVVSFDTGTIYFPGDTATIYVHVTVNGVPTSPEGLNLEVLLYQPDRHIVTLNATLVEAGLYTARFQIPTTGSLGTYAVVARAYQEVQESSSIASFEVKPSWLSQQAPRIAGAAAAIGGIALASFAWRRGYFRVRTKRFRLFSCSSKVWWR